MIIIITRYIYVYIYSYEDFMHLDDPSGTPSVNINHSIHVYVISMLISTVLTICLNFYSQARNEALVMHPKICQRL
jgi:hypothetical protein